MRELGIGFVAYSPLGRGFLTGGIRSVDDLDEKDFRRRGPALPGREPRAQSRARRAGRGDRRGEGRQGLADRARVGALARRRHRPDPGHEAPLVPRGERGRGGDRAHRRPSSSGSSSCSRPGRRRATATRHVDGQPRSERERLARERRQHLRRHPERRRHVAGVVAVAPVRAPHSLQVAEGRRAGACAGREQGLDRPGGRLGVGAASLRQLEAAVRVLMAPEEDDAALDRLTAYSRRTQRLHRGGRVIRVGGTTREPGPATRRPLRREEGLDETGRDRLTGLPKRENRPDRRVHELSGRVAAQARQEVVRPVPGRRASHRHERDVRRRLRLLPREVLRGVAGVRAGRNEPERRPGGDLRIAEAAVVALQRLDVAHGSRERGRGGNAGEQLHAHTTSVRDRRSNRSSTRLNSGPATSASTTFPVACAMLKGTPAASRASSAASVCG